MILDKEISSPCIINCYLDPHDICVGCFRSIDEIMAWQSLSTPNKQQVLDNCQERRKDKNAQLALGATTIQSV